MVVDNILFDFNGTLVNDLELCLNLLNDMLVYCKHNRVSKEEYLNIFTFPVIEYYKKAGFVFPKDDFDSLAKYFIKEYSRLNKYCPLQDGVIEILEYLKSCNKTLSVVSASEINLLNSQLEMYDIKKYFIGISGLDNINAMSKIETAKRYIKEKDFDLNKTVLIGDTLHDEEVANALGVKCILLAQGHQSKEVLSTSNSLIIDNLLELKKYIK